MELIKITRLSAGIFMISLSVLTGCGTMSQINPFVQTRTVYKEVPVQAAKADVPPGVVEYVWEEPMVDVVDVPPGLDPEGHYYRPAHQAVVEVRQGRWRHYRSSR